MTNAKEDTIKLLRRTADKLENGDISVQMVSYRPCPPTQYEPAGRLEVKWVDGDLYV